MYSLTKYNHKGRKMGDLDRQSIAFLRYWVEGKEGVKG
ncbi:hypothetical protein C943_01425 [Mariniradius saccharolyticus AK6]|uniref:Uncharacterized protein n=1 Tax=Mariniradius saccharolyticus AK6 TaxID=1239962 RepID=M7XC11_9BACT|nr:hypothetical protein C943_01425 [Mariniradius saccharolyticus AK6]